MTKQIVIVGASHRSAPVECREHFARVEDDPELLLHALQQEHMEEVALLSTCNRVELVVVADHADEVENRVRRVLRQILDVSDEWLTAYTRTYADRAALEHLFRVSSSLDSIVVGEPQILGQVKEAYRRYARIGATGPILNRVFHRSFRAAKRVRTETRIAENAVSVSYAAVELAKQRFENLSELQVLVIGAGKMGALAAKNLQQAGVRRIEVLNRDLERALALERSLGVVAGSLETLRERLTYADIVITSTGAREYVIRREDIELAQRARGEKSLLLVDIAVPRDVDPNCALVSGVSLYDVDDLERVVLSNLDARLEAAKEAERLIEEEIVELEKWLESATSVDTLVRLREHFFEVLERELEKGVRENPKVSADEAAFTERFARQLLRKILHTPTKALRDAPVEQMEEYARVTRALFGLEVVPRTDKDSE